AGDALPFTARHGEDLARDGAAAWADDARLIYVENDEGVDALGTAERWGYLFYSPALDAARAYSVRGDEIRTATDLEFDFAAPPLPGEWIDSAQALAAAEEKGAKFREKHGGSVTSMFLVRGLLYPENPDVPTWAVVYGSPTTSGLWVVVDAVSGKVVKTWRG
ncbi:MAG: PepSY domain-containing protein, partial [Gemmatimonadetes bacterium]|nr:PepSY domain-containing protein [Gemmatimonadota bacterium]